MSPIRIVPPIFAALLALGSCIPLTHCSDEPVAPPDTTGPDTTSHAVSWTIVDTLGDRHSSFFDVCAVNDTCVYAVGMMFMGYDSSGSTIRYNVARWDGQRWHKLAIHTSRSDGAAAIDVIRAVYAFGPDDVWITGEASGYAHWDGKQWKHGLLQGSKGTVNRIFGFSPDDIYFVCSQGGITRRYISHYAEVWEFVESGTQSDIYDIWGANDTLLALACDIYRPDGSLGTGKSEIIRIVNGAVSRFPDSNLDKGLQTIWFSARGKKLVSGGWNQEWDGVKWWGFQLPSHWFITKLAGNHDYDIWAVGHGSTVDHYNGVSWKNYSELSFNEKYMFFSVDCIPGQVWVVGDDNRAKSVIIHGRY